MPVPVPVSVPYRYWFSTGIVPGTGTEFLDISKKPMERFVNIPIHMRPVLILLLVLALVSLLVLVLVLHATVNGRVN